MTRVSLVLLLLLVASSLWLVKTAYEARRLFADLHRAENEALRLDGDYKRLEAERQAQATSLRVERTAREKLAMRTVTPAVTMYVVDPAASATAGVPR
jgi:cell division protein FtsL